MKNLQSIALIIMTVFLSVSISSCSKSDAYTAPADDPNTYKISIEATQFNPASLTMLPGAKVTWTNTDSQPHSVVSDDGISFNSGSLNGGESISFTPGVTGTYGYHCGIHPTVTGTVLVATR